jgi:uncharacterized iron-regulated membrane protein
MADDPSLSRPADGPAPAAGALPPRRRRRVRAPGAYLALPLWSRFVLAAAVAVGLLVVMVLFVEANNTNTNPSLNEASEVRANREAELLVAQDQAPHVVSLAAGAAPALALERAVHARMAAQVARGAIEGPLQAARCRLRAPATGAGRRYSCTVVAAGVTYPFLGVVDPRAHRLTYCKRDPPPLPSDNVPVSRRCLR